MAKARRRRRSLSPARRRLFLQVLGVVVLVGLLLWGTDTLARIGAQTLLARNIQDATGVEITPEVKVHGLFFVPQVIRGAYSDVEVTTLGIESGPLRIARVQSQLSDVRIPFHDVLVRDIRRVGIGHSVENLDLTYDDLNAYFITTGRRLQVAPGPDGTVRVMGTVDVLNQKVPVSADAELWVEDDTLRMSPQTLATGSGSLDTASRLLLGQRLRLIVPLGALPFGHRLTGAQADAAGVHLTAEGSGIVVQP